MKRFRSEESYIVLYAFFVAGIHHFYLKQYRRGLLNSLIFLVSLCVYALGLYQSDWESMTMRLTILINTGILLFELPRLLFFKYSVLHYNAKVAAALIDKVS